MLLLLLIPYVHTHNMPKERATNLNPFSVPPATESRGSTQHAVVVLYSAEFTKPTSTYFALRTVSFQGIYGTVCRSAHPFPACSWARQPTELSQRMLLPGQVVNQQKKGDKWCDEGSHPPTWFGLKHLYHVHSHMNHLGRAQGADELRASNCFSCRLPSWICPRFQRENPLMHPYHSPESGMMVRE
jgi:hypothetical protein